MINNFLVLLGFKIHKKSDIKDEDNINNVKDHVRMTI